VFIDASAILAILLNEEDASVIVRKMQKSRTLYFSPIVRFEATIRLASLKSRVGKPIHKTAFEQAQMIIDAFANQYNVSLLPITGQESQLSLDAYRRFGKGTGHQAQLNMGDCFSYACAKSKHLKLLFKGNDFIHTDIQMA